MRPLAIVDYGMGNLRSVAKAFERLGHAAEVTRDPERIASAPGVVLPGVGAFGACMANLTGSTRPSEVRFAMQADRKSTRLNSIHANISYSVFCLKKKKDVE